MTSTSLDLPAISETTRGARARYLRARRDGLHHSRSAIAEPCRNKRQLPRRWLTHRSDRAANVMSGRRLVTLLLRVHGAAKLNIVPLRSITLGAATRSTGATP